MVKPIPKKLLIHEVKYEEFYEDDRYGEGYKLPITLKNVRVQVGSAFSRSNTNENISYQAMLIYDVKNSSTSVPFEFKEKSKVTFNGKTMLVQKVNPVYAFTLHHYELELI